MKVCSSIRIFLTLILLIVTCVVATEHKVLALVNLQPDPNGWVQTVPTPIYNDMRRSDTHDQSPSLFAWISDDNNTAAQRLTVKYGTPSVALKFNMAGVVGWAPNQVIANRGKVISASGNGPSGNPIGPGTVSNLTTNPLQLTFTPGQNTPGKYDYNGDVFNFDPDGSGTKGFIREGEYSVYVVTKSINQFKNSAGQLIYRCVPSGGDVPSWDSWSLCPTTGWTFKIYVDIEPPPPPYNNQASIDLCASGSPVGNIVQPGSSYKLCPKVNNVGTGGTLGIFTMAVENRYLATSTTSYATNNGQADLSPPGNKAQIFGVYKDYKTNDTNCSANLGNARDCWLWLFQDLMPNKSVNSNFTFKVKNTAPIGGQVCFRPFVRRSTPSVLSHTGSQLCFTIQNPPNCPAGTDYAGQPVSSQPDRNGDGVVDANDCNNPPPPTNYPFIQIKGNSVISGANFTNNGVCSLDPKAATANVYTNGFHGSDTDGGKGGSSNAQYGVWASGDIGQIIAGLNTFRANYGYVRNPSGTNEDTRDGLFANQNWTDTNSQYGNFYDGDTSNPSLPCIDISTDIAATAVPISGVGTAQAFLSTPTSGTQLINGNQSIQNITIPAGVNKTLIVAGNLTIKGNVSYSGGFTSGTVPNLKIIASNIFIERATNRVDADLIAFPDSSPISRGIIDTCSDMIWQFTDGTANGIRPGEWPTNGKITTDSCNTGNPGLTINGSVAARRILWKRTNGTLGSKEAAADPACYFANYTDNADVPKITNTATAVQRYEKCAAEIVNNNPGSYISNLNLNSSNTLEVVPVDTKELPSIY